eukprot:g2044.t1
MDSFSQAGERVLSQLNAEVLRQVRHMAVMSGGSGDGMAKEIAQLEETCTTSLDKMKEVIRDGFDKQHHHFIEQTKWQEEQYLQKLESARMAFQVKLRNAVRAERRSQQGYCKTEDEHLDRMKRQVILPSDSAGGGEGKEGKEGGGGGSSGGGRGAKGNASKALESVDPQILLELQETAQRKAATVAVWVGRVRDCRNKQQLAELQAALEAKERELAQFRQIIRVVRLQRLQVASLQKALTKAKSQRKERKVYDVVRMAQQHDKHRMAAA